jgi:hypothetical protein
LLQGAAVPQAPLAVHVSTPLPLQVFWPGAHEPVHVPPTQVWLLHAVPTVQVPEALQVSGWLLTEQLV